MRQAAISNHDGPTFFSKLSFIYSFFKTTIVEKSMLKMNMELLHESERQSQIMIDSQFQHNFQNQLPYSPFQEEPITQSMEDMIQTQNIVT